MLRKTRHLILGLFSTVLLGGCNTTYHPIAPATLGKASSSNEMEPLIDQPGPVLLDTIESASISTPLAGLLNLKSATAKKAKLKNRKELIHIYMHVLKHPKYGTYLIDTGISQKVLNNPKKVGLSWGIRKLSPLKKIKIHKTTEAVLRDINGPIAGVFFTHLHIDHLAGLPDISNEVPLYIGASESSEKRVTNILSYSSSDALFKGKGPLLELKFKADPQNKFVGIIDIFSDGSFFAISVPGHTMGSIAYLARTPKGPVLLTGDTSHTCWGWENTVEPGYFTHDQKGNLESLKKLKALEARHPHIDVRCGHQRLKK
jgi:N-acyl homoserine lactone hydrolase